MKIAVIGPEATGKTTLCALLAAHFGGRAAKEYARAYWLENKLPAGYVLSADEMCEVMAGQKAAEQGEDALLFVDASCIHGALYSAMREEDAWLSFDYDTVDERVMEYATSGDYDAIILCRPHVALEWEDDGMRAMPNIIIRHAFADAAHAFVRLHYAGKPCIVVDEGDWNARVQQASEQVTALLAQVKQINPCKAQDAPEQGKDETYDR